ncbi:MAG: hypothetical protein ACLPV8_22565 [Steroidobacteraceae bacterium]
MPAQVGSGSQPLRPPPAVELLRRIGLTKHDYGAICGVVSSYQGSVVAANLDSVYQRFPAVNATRAEFYTSLSDGKRIFTHIRQKATATLVWDVAHLLGHMFQWNMTAQEARQRELRYYGARARRLAVRDFQGASSAVLKGVLQYEFEANRFAYTALLGIRGADPHTPFAAAVADYVAHDLAFIINYYLRRRPAHTAHAAHESGLGPALATTRSKLCVVALPDPKTFRFHSFNLLSVPVVHD